MATLAIAAGGAVLGGVTGGLVPGVGGVLGAQLGFLGGSVLGSILFPPEREIPGPNVEDIRVGSSAIGRPIPLCFGAVRIAGNYIWADEIKRKKQTQTVGKGAGTKVTSYKLFASFAVSLGEGPIAGVLRIWADNKLIFDISDTNLGSALHQSFIDAAVQFPSDLTITDSEGIELGTQDFGRIRVYLGTETQLPDPLIQTDSRIGDAFESPAADPKVYALAHRGMAYIVFQDFPLEIVNNHYPQIQVELATKTTNAFPRRTITSTSFSKNSGVWAADMQTQYAFGQPVSVASTILYNFTNPKQVTLQNFSGNVLVHPGPRVRSRNLYTTSASPSKSILRRYNIDTGALVAGPSDPWGTFNVIWGIEYPNTASPRVYVSGSFSFNIAVFGLDLTSPLATPNIAAQVPLSVPRWGTTPLIIDDHLWVPVRPNLPSATEIAGLAEIDPLTGTLIDFHYVQTASPQLDDVFAASFIICHDPLTNSILVATDAGGVIRRFNLSTKTIDGEVAVGTINIGVPFKSGPFEGKMWVHSSTAGGGRYDEVDTVAMKVTRSITNAVGTYGVDTQNRYANFDPSNNAVIIGNFLTSQLEWMYLDRQQKVNVSAKEIVDSLADKCNVTSAQRDTSALSSHVMCGYAIGQRITGRKALEPLAAAFNFDVRDSDFVAEFFNMGGASVKSIPEDDLGAIASRDGTSQAIEMEETRDSELELPERVDVVYVNRRIDYNTDVQHAKRPREAISTRDLLTVQIPIVFDGGDVPKRIAERILYQAWARRTKLKLPTTYEHVDLDVGDVFDTTRNGVSFTIMAEQIALGADMVLEIRGVSEDAAASVSVASGNSGGGFTPQAITAQITSEFFLLDQPLLRDQDEGLVLHTAAAPMAAGNWPGAEIIRSDDGGISFEKIIDVFGPDEVAIWGIALTVLADGICTVFDEINTVDVRLFNGALSSGTRLDVLNGANPIIIGGEFLHYQDATALGGDQWRLSNLLRGRRGTDGFTTSHVAGDLVIVPTTATMHAIPVDTAELNKIREYKAVTIGTFLESAPQKSLSFTGVSKKPYSVVHISGTRDGSGNWTVNWFRRTRLGGGWTDNVDVLLGEESQSYELEVLDAPGGNVLLTKTGITTTSVQITAAEIESILGSPAIDTTQLNVVVYQISATVGRGFGRAATLNADGF